jgi:MYXO-CTERM domain-containing protein
VAGFDSPMHASSGCSVGDAGVGTRAAFPAALLIALAAMSRRRRRG